MFAGESLTSAWRKTTRLNQYLIGIACFIFIVVLGGTYCYYKIYADPVNTFWSMIDNNLSTRGVVKQSIQQNGTEKITSYSQLLFTSSPTLHGLRTIVNSSSPGTKLTIESIGTASADYQRYTHIERPTPKGKSPDYSEVYKIWLESSSKERPANQLSANLFGPYLFGNLSHKDKSQLSAQLRKVYQVTFTGQQNVNGHRIYKYSVKIDMRSYVAVVQNYSATLGLKSSLQSSNSFSSASEMIVTTNVDVRSRHITSVLNADKAESEVIYSAYGIGSDVRKPDKVYSIADLQHALESASN